VDREHRKVDDAGGDRDDAEDERRSAEDADEYRGEICEVGPQGCDATGGPMLSIQLAGEGARHFAAYSTAHVGEFFALLLDGRVIAAPLIQAAISDGAFNVTLPADSLPMPLDALAAILASGPLPDSWRQGS
jgi:preprotein translocase subunit SecD